MSVHSREEKLPPSETRKEPLISADGTGFPGIGGTTGPLPNPDLGIPDYRGAGPSGCRTKKKLTNHSSASDIFHNHSL